MISLIWPVKETPKEPAVLFIAFYLHKFGDLYKGLNTTNVESVIKLSKTKN